jgi:hypothetical protein
MGGLHKPLKHVQPEFTQLCLLTYTFGCEQVVRVTLMVYDEGVTG